MPDGRAPQAEPTGRTKALYAAIVFIFVVGIMEGISALAILIVSPRLAEPIQRNKTTFLDQSQRIDEMLTSDSAKRFIVPDSVLGWRQRAGYRSALYTIGPDGLRGVRQYTPRPSAGTLRVDAFGDSFVFGSEVGDTSAWPAILERMYPEIEVPNYGVGGYGLDQTFLAELQHGKDLHPQAVIVGYVPDDLGRIVNVYRRFLSVREPPLAKPRFLLSDSGALTLLPAPWRNDQAYSEVLERPRDVLALGRHDHWYSPLVYRDPIYDYSATVRLLTASWIRVARRYFDSNRMYDGPYANPRSEAFRLEVAVFEQFADSIRQQGARPIFVFFPDRESLEGVVRGARPSYAPLLDTLRAHGLQPLDASEALATSAAADLRGLFMTAHYSPRANQLVAEWLGRVGLPRSGKGISSDTGRTVRPKSGTLY